VSRNASLIKVTKTVTNCTSINDTVVNQSVNVNIVSKAISRPVPRVRVREADGPRAESGAEPQDDELVAVRPGARRGQKPREIPGQVQRTDHANRPDHAKRPDSEHSQSDDSDEDRE